MKMSKWKRTRIKNLGGIKAYREYMKGIGQKGGSKPTDKPKGFASMDKEIVAEIGRKGGQASRRGTK